MKFTNFNVAIAAIASLALGVEGRGNFARTPRPDPCAEPDSNTRTIVRVSAAVNPNNNGCGSSGTPTRGNAIGRTPITPPPSSSTGGGAFGDPHFKTWSGHQFDFQGACDLVLMQSKNFSNGAGLDIHVRTEIRDFYSFINGVAIKIGNDVFEVFSYGDYYINGKQGEKLEGVKTPHEYHPVTTMYGKDENGSTAQYLVEHTGTMSGKRHEFRVNLGGSEDNHITIKIYEEFVAVYITESVQEQQSFSDSVGLMGHFITGEMLSRDGVTDMSAHPTEFGKEWRVGNDEKQEGNDMVLFHDQSNVSGTCTMPDLSLMAVKQLKLRKDGGNLKENGTFISLESATKKCNEVYPMEKDEAMRESCVYDILATGVLELADAGAM